MILLETIIQSMLILLFGVLGVLSAIQQQWSFVGINISLAFLYVFLYLGKYIFK